MKNVLIIGATGSVGQVVRQTLLDQTDDQLTLFSRSAGQLAIDQSRETHVSGDATDPSALRGAVKGQDLVFVALKGDMPAFASAIIQAMDEEAVSRLVFIDAMGIYNEAPAEWMGSQLDDPYNDPILAPFRVAADEIEASDLNYTIIRPGWYREPVMKVTNYQITQRNEPFGGPTTSRESIAAYVLALSQDDQLDNRANVGINLPKTE
ncbi:NAD(P)H-binding protein [Levilactobacillus bambusae]|uniref:NAD(P)-dependent oxidoreductase n=1 Tax=Levilactobacillus bambusae TaxID=2024736 RepID=A0A2V1MZ67_9LACO|nr:NAD(P)H-binding protein [Levilactobacillus bambusae]PWG00311.1 NAD(P)-dependent oxidoreductase [Levilactobacillus bambusae]